MNPADRLSLAAAAVIVAGGAVAYGIIGPKKPEPAVAAVADAGPAPISTVPERALDGGALPPSIPNAEMAVKVARTRIRMCWMDQVSRHPGTSGTVTAAIMVGTNGRVTDVQWVSQEGPFEDDTLTCVKTALREVLFDPPIDRQPATVIAPFGYVDVHKPAPAKPLPGAGDPLLGVPAPNRQPGGGTALPQPPRSAPPPARSTP